MVGIKRSISIAIHLFRHIVMIKRISTWVFASLFVVNVAAEGYQVNLQSTRQSGMGHLGASLKLGAESMHFNPAGLSFMEPTIDLSAGFTSVFAEAAYEKSGVKDRTNNTVSLPFYMYAGFKIYDGLVAGVSVNTPYGSSLNWGKNWRGADLIQDIALQSFNIQPTVSYRLTDRLSVGAGLMIMFGNVELSRAMMPAGTLTAMGLGDEYKDVIPVSATLSGKSGVRLGYNIGMMFDVTDRLTLGTSFRSCVRMKVKEGTAALDYASDAIQGLIQAIPTFPQLDKGSFTAEMPLPANLNVGISYQLNDRLLLAAEWQAIFWKAYDELDIQFSETVLGGYNLNAIKNYKNTSIFRLGGEYALTKRFDLRLGVYYDQSPIRRHIYNPETPGMDKIGITTGFSFRPVGPLSVDFAFTYIQGLGRDGSYDYENGLKQQKNFSGHYTSVAYAPSLGLSYRF